MKLAVKMYQKIHKKDPPYYYYYSIGKILMKPIRKWLTNTVAANCPFNSVRIFIYRMCGFKIGKHTFIGMKAYLDDMHYDQLVIGNNVVISYGVFFACHGYRQHYSPIVIEDDSYLGMRCNVISKNSDPNKVGVTIGKGALVGACTLVNKDVPPFCTAVGVPCRIIPPQEKDN